MIERNGGTFESGTPSHEWRVFSTPQWDNEALSISTHVQRLTL